MDVDPDSTTAKAEECEEKPDNANIDLMEINPDNENSLVSKKEVVYADQCYDMASSAKSKNDSHINEFVNDSTLITNHLIGCVSKSQELGTTQLDSCYKKCSRLENSSISEEIGASIVSEGLSDFNEHKNGHNAPNEVSVATPTDIVAFLEDQVTSNEASVAPTDLVALCDDDVTSNEASDALTDVVTLLEDNAAPNEASLALNDVVTDRHGRTSSTEVAFELTDVVAHLDDHATSNDAAKKLTNLFTHLDNHMVSSEASLEQSYVFDLVSTNLASEHECSSNFVSLERPEIGSTDLQAMEATDMNKSECDMVSVSEKASQLLDDHELSEKPAKCTSDDSVTEIFNSVNAEILPYEESMNSRNVPDFCESEFLDARGVRETTVSEFIDEFISLPVTNAIDQQLTVSEEFVERTNVLAEPFSIVNTTGSGKSPVSWFPNDLISMTKTEAVTNIDHCHKSEKCDVTLPRELQESELVDFEFEAGDNVAEIFDKTVVEDLTENSDVCQLVDSNTDVSLSTCVQLQINREESGKQLSSDDHKLTAVFNSDVEEQLHLELPTTLSSINETESPIHLRRRVCETITEQNSFLPAAVLDGSTTVNSTSMYFGSTSQVRQGLFCMYFSQ